MLTKSLVLLLALVGAASGQSISNGEQIIPFSANLSLNVTYAAAFVTLTGNVTSITPATGSFGGQSYHLTICQGTGGPYTIPSTWSATTGATAITTTGCTRFRLVWDDPSSAWVSTTEGVGSTGATGPTGAAGTPATPNTASTPLVISSNNISIPVATTSAPGYLASADWTTFNNKQATLTLTTTGTSGAATLSGGALNIPNYAGASSGINSAASYGVPYYATATTVSGVSGTGIPVFTTSAAPTFTAIGTSGATIPLNNSANIFSANQQTGPTGTATSGTNYGSYTANLCGSYYSSGALADCMGTTITEGSGVNPTMNYAFTRGSASTGATTFTFNVSSSRSLAFSVAGGNPSINGSTGVALQYSGTTEFLVGSGGSTNVSSLPLVSPTYLSTVGTLASAATIAPTTAVVSVSGTTAIATITAPSGMSSTVGGCIHLIPTGLWTTTTSGNIALATTAVVSRVLTMCYNGTSWYPSY